MSPHELNMIISGHEVPSSADIPRLLQMRSNCVRFLWHCINISSFRNLGIAKVPVILQNIRDTLDSGFFMCSFSSSLRRGFYKIPR